MRSTYQLRFALVLMFVVAFAASCLAQAAGDAGLTNADIVKMMKAGIPESIIVREIRMSGAQLSTTPSALIQLKKQGASEGILSAVLDSQSGPDNYSAEPTAAVDVTTQAAILRSHHLPTFEADLRLNSKQREKISVGQNHIKVEQSGVPVFSLKWKTPDSSK